MSFIFFFKQKTAYYWRISGWSSDVCSSDLYAALSSIPETDGVPEAMEMVRLLVKAHEACAKTARSVFPIADKSADEPTCDLLTQRMQLHEKTAWMLRSLLE